MNMHVGIYIWTPTLTVRVLDMKEAWGECIYLIESPQNKKKSPNQKQSKTILKTMIIFVYRNLQSKKSNPIYL